MNCPASGISLPGQVENSFHFPWQSLSHFLPLRGKIFSFFLVSRHSLECAKADILHGKIIPPYVPRFGTRIAKAGM
jgi:hypothetical protein